MEMSGCDYCTKIINGFSRWSVFAGTLKGVNYLTKASSSMIDCVLDMLLSLEYTVHNRFFDIIKRIKILSLHTN